MAPAPDSPPAVPASVPTGTPADPRSDTQLMRALAAGDRQALAALVQRHQHHVWGLACRLTGHAADADDLTQEAFLRIWGAAARYEERARFTTFLYRIVVNLCRDWQRRRRHAPPSLPADAELPAPVAPDVQERDELSRRVQTAIAALPERQRTALILHRYQGLSYRQIAATTGWSESAVESLLVRAIAALRENLAR